MFNGFMASLSKEMTKVAQAVSTFDSSTTDWVDGPSTASILYDSTGTTIDAFVELQYLLKTGSGAAYTGSVTIEWTVIEGNVNGRTLANGASTANGMSVSNSVGTLVISSMATPTAQIRIDITRNGLKKSMQVVLTRVLAPPSGGGGGGGGGSSANQTSGFTQLTTGPSTFSQITNTLNTGVVPAGKTTATIAVSLVPKMNKNQFIIAGNAGPWNIQYKLRRNISGTRSDVGSPSSANSNPDPGPIDESSEGFVSNPSGSMIQNFTFTVSPGTAYDLEIWATISSGTFSATYPVTFTGSVTITLS